MDKLFRSYTTGEAEAHLNGLLEAAHIAETELCHNVGAILRSMVMVRKASRMPLEPVLKAANEVPWRFRYWGSLKWPNGRVEAAADEVMKGFATVQDFLGATPEDLRAKPGCGPATLKALLEAQDSIRNNNKGDI